jgi:hypothetical protein
MRLTHLALVGVLGVTAVLGCATARGAKSPAEGSAAQLGRSPCPSDVRAAVAEIDASADWRLVQGPGLRYCVPAAWTLAVYGAGDSWQSNSSSIRANRWRTIEMDFPRTQTNVATHGGYFQRPVGGHLAEFWYQDTPRQTQDPDPAFGNRTFVYQKGYETYAVWREPQIVLAGHAKTLKDVVVIRGVVQTVRFDSAAVSGQRD